jgi:hypothetical protein
MSAKRGSLATRSTSARSPVYRNYDTGMRIARTN